MVRWQSYGFIFNCHAFTPWKICGYKFFAKSYKRGLYIFQVSLTYGKFFRKKWNRQELRSFHHENTRKRCLFYHERIRKRRKNILFSGISIFSDVFGIEDFYFPKKAKRTKRTKMLSWVVWVVFKKTTDVLFIKDNEDNFGQLFYHEKYEKTFCFRVFRFFRIFFGIESFYIPKKAEKTKKTKKHFFGNFEFFGCFRNKRFLYHEKDGKGKSH